MFEKHFRCISFTKIRDNSVILTTLITDYITSVTDSTLLTAFVSIIKSVIQVMIEM